MTGENKRRADTFEILEAVPYEDYISTNEVAKKTDSNWATTLRRLFFLEYKGYLKFIELKQKTGTKYAWKRLKEDEEKNTSLSKSFLEMLEYVPREEFMSTEGISKSARRNNKIIYSMLLYLESRGEVVCFRTGPKKQINRRHHWRRLSEREKEDLKHGDKEKIEKRYEKECFKYNE